MTDEELHTAFEKAYEKASKTNIQLPPDIMLHLYAYYKHAKHSESFYTPSGDSEIRNAFKLNALFQVKDLSREEAMERYIETVNKYIID